jgi:hypothetical protein
LLVFFGAARGEVAFASTSPSAAASAAAFFSAESDALRRSDLEKLEHPVCS